MSLSIYDAAVPTLLRTLKNLTNILDKGNVHCEKEKIEPSVMLAARLYPDMFSLTRQVQVVSDQTKGAVARLAGLEPPKFPDVEGSFAELRTRLEKTASFVEGVEAARFQGADTRPIELKFPQVTLSFKSGWQYLFTFVLPNVHFHTATAYDILRHNGVKLGKPDFIGDIS